MINTAEWIKKQYDETYANIGFPSDSRKALKKDLKKEFEHRINDAERYLRRILRKTDITVIVSLIRELGSEDVRNV